MNRKTSFEGYTTRKKELQDARSWPWLGSLACVEAMDSIAPGWKRARLTEIPGRKDKLSDGTPYVSLDIVYELPGRVSLRGWDMTGAICREDA